MGVYDRKPKAVRVRTRWLGLARGGSHGPAFWIEVGRRVRAARVSNDLEAVRRIVRQVETKQKVK